MVKEVVHLIHALSDYNEEGELSELIERLETSAGDDLREAIKEGLEACSMTEGTRVLMDFAYS